MAVSSDLQRDTLMVLRLKLSRNKFVSGYPVTERQIAICSAFAQPTSATKASVYGDKPPTTEERGLFSGWVSTNKRIDPARHQGIK
ncbi:hypothetical protein KVG88_23365 [Pseudomonas sp. SWRI74]|uniref:Uncharacterized protein n=1 Tax=Pseudomonas azerbaijanoccidentalis TaxID=2842347 RepID=A0ABS6QVN1_9PSED|nr:hypothetical protein [Pseudomonas azerbaijanoccidentalis]MBV4523003.1 hypothetical protein [Pseudomonas azerbaijanoccidentalis]